MAKTIYHVYTEDGFESAHRTQAAALKAARRGANRRCMQYTVVRTSPRGYTGGGEGTVVESVTPSKRCKIR